MLKLGRNKKQLLNKVKLLNQCGVLLTPGKIAGLKKPGKMISIPRFSN